jgi:ABC-type uncharacterized transport system fused permease/ATPase subunit
VRGLAERVCALEAAMDASTHHEVRVETGSDKIDLQNINVRPPNPSSDALAKGLTMTIEAQQHTVVRGPNGIGKTSLFRTLGGLWAPTLDNDTESAKPHIRVPDALYIMPQDPYFPDGPLAEQITYPHPAVGLDSDQFAALMEVVGLKELAKRYTMETEEDWSNVLSGGQKQRLSWARLYFHKPKFAMVDEATSAVSVDMVDRLYSHAKAGGTTLVTISHQAAVDRHHIQALDLATQSKWAINRV